MKIKVVSTSWNLLASITDRRFVWSQPVWPRLQSAMKSAALTVQIRIILDWVESWTVLSILSLRNPNACPQEARAHPHQGVLPCMRRNNVIANCEMHRLKQTLWLIEEDGKREGEKIKNKALLTRLINEITLCCPGGEARGMAQRASTDKAVDLSGNKEPCRWWASEKVSKKVGLAVPLKEFEFKSSVQKGASLSWHPSLGPPSYNKLQRVFY